MATIVTSTPPLALSSGLSTTFPVLGPFRGSKPYYGVFTGQANFLPIGDTTYQQVGQSFTTPVVGEISITRTSAYLYKVGSPADSLQADIYLADSGTSLPVGASLATSTNTIPGSAVVGVYQGIFFFAPLVLPNGTKYVVMLKRTGSLDNGNYFGYITNSNNTDAAQTGSYWNGSAWLDVGYDFGLEVHGIADTYYHMGRSSTLPATLYVYRATAPDWVWILQSSRNFTTEILSLSAYVFGQTISLLVQDGTALTAVTTKYTTYNTAQNSFSTNEILFSNANVTGQVAGVGAGASIAVRSTGEVVALYSGMQTNSTGTFRSRLYSRRRSPATFSWTTEEQVDLNDDNDNTLPVAVLGAADRVHLGFQAGSTFTVRTLTAANVLGTSTASMAGPTDAASLSYGGGTRVVFVQGGAGSKNAYFDSADIPTITVSDQGIATATTPHRIAINGSDVFRIYRSSVDDDLYMIKSTDGGATYGAPVLFFTGTVAAMENSLSRSLSRSVYPRGLNTVIGSVVNDNGALYYCEYIIAAPPPANEMRLRYVGAWQKPITHVKHAGTWKVPVTFVKHAGTWKQMT